MSNASVSVVADIGGTNTRVALAHKGEVDRRSIQRYSNSEYAGIEPVLLDYLSQQTEWPGSACVAMAGPVFDGRGTLTNLAWTVDRTGIGTALGAETVAVLNDLQAQGHGLAELDPDHLTPLLPGDATAPHAARLVVGVGTGLNAAPVFQLNGQTLVPPAEAGHVSLPVQSDEELRLFAFSNKAHGNPGVEEVLSGRGIECIYAWLCHEHGGTPQDNATVLRAYRDGSDPKATATIKMFARLLGRFAGNLALVTLPYGGIYLCGGVAQHMGPHLLDAGFGEAFLDKGRFSTLMAGFPVSLITDDYAALVGCARHLQEVMHQN